MGIGQADADTTAALLATGVGNSTPYTSDLEAAMAELAAAQPGYGTAEEYFEGTRGEYFASIRLRRAMARTGSGFRINFAKVPVRAVADRLELSSITTDNDDANTVLQDLWEDNQLDLEFPNLLLRACEYGDAYAIVWPSEVDDDLDPAGLDLSKDTFEGENTPLLTDTDNDDIINVDVFYNSPKSMRLFYDPERPLKKKFAIKKWVLSNTKQVRIDLYYPNRVERYISERGILECKAEDMQPFTDDGQGDADGVIDNPFGVPPVFHFRTDRPYGCPEHFEFYGVQDAVRKLVITHMSGVDYQGFKQRYALMDPETDTGEATNLDEDEFAFPLDTGATSRPGDPQSQLTADAGSFWQLKGMKAVGQFDESEPAVFLDPLTVYLRCGGQVSNTPMRYMNPSGDPPSGESLRVEEAPFVKKVTNRQLSFGSTAREMFGFALRIAGGGDARTPGRFGNVKVVVSWKSPATSDDLTSWQLVAAKLAAGMPPKVAFMEAGCTQAQVDEWFGSNDDDLPFRVDLLTKIGLAMQAMAAASATGLFQPEQIAGVIAALLREPELAGPDGGTA